MRATFRSVAVAFLVVLGAAALGISAMFTAGLSLAATSSLIMGGTGRPDPDDFPGYVPNVRSFYIFPNTSCDSDATCEPIAVFTPETAWPVYGGLTAPTWKQSILQGSDLFHDAVLDQLATDDEAIILFGYSQSGAILALEKNRLVAEGIDTSRLEIVVIGNVSRPNGGLNVRLPFTVPIVEFPFGPPMPTDTGIPTDDIAFKWDIIADSPLYLFNPLAWTNALLGFQYVHGTFPDPTAASPDSTPGGYSVEEWQAIMDDPETFAALYPDLVNVQTFGDTRYVTVTPKVLPLVEPLHDLGLSPLADLLEPALRVIIEQTGYDRSIPYGQPTPFRLIPIFNPIQLTLDVIAAIPQGIAQMLNNLNAPATLAPTTGPSTLSSLAAGDQNRSFAATTPEVSEGSTTPETSLDITVAAEPEPAKTDPEPTVAEAAEQKAVAEEAGPETKITPSRIAVPAVPNSTRPKAWSKVGSEVETADPEQPLAELDNPAPTTETPAEDVVQPAAPEPADPASDNESPDNESQDAA